MITENFKEDLKIIWYFLRHYKMAALGVLLMMIASGAFESLNLAVLYPIMNYGLNITPESHHLEFLEPVFKQMGAQNNLLFSCILLIVVTFLATGLKIFYYYCNNKLIQKIIADNQMEIFKKFYSSGFPYFVRKQQGNLIYASTVAPMSIANNLMFMTRIANTVITCLFFTVLLLLLSWKATIIMVIFGLVYLFFIRQLTTRLINKSSKLIVKADQEKNVVLNEFFTGIKPIKVFQTLDYWKHKYADAVRRSVLYNFKVWMGKVYPDSFIKLIFFMLIACLGIFYSFRSPSDVISMIPVLGTYAAVASRLLPYVNLLGNDIVAMARNFPDTKIVYDLLNEKTEEIEEGHIVLKDFQRHIAFTGVGFKHVGMSDDLLKDVSFSIDKRKVTAIVGPSGAGKSTLINLLLKLYKVDRGQIAIDGVSIKDLTNASYLGMIGYVGQETFIFNGTIKENILFGRTGFTDSDIEDAAKLANAGDFILNSEKGFETIVGDAGVKLSGGQRQRIAIARAMLGKPQILILDEATSSLDNISERSVQEAINNICHYTTVLIIAHRLSTVQNADKIIVFDRGRIIEEGTHQQLLDKGQTYYNLYTS